MKKIRDKKTSLKTVIPILIVILFILYLTTQSPHDTRQLSDGLQEVLLSEFPDAQGRWTTDLHWFRSLLHLPLYFILGIVAGAALRKFWKAFSICAVIAASDETLKIFLPTREFQAIDVGMDIVGAIVGIAVVWLVRYIFTSFADAFNGPEL